MVHRDAAGSCRAEVVRRGAVALLDVAAFRDVVALQDAWAVRCPVEMGELQAASEGAGRLVHRALDPKGAVPEDE